MLGDRLIGLLAPHSCVRCGREGRLVCVDCLPAIVTTKRSSCFLCNALTEDWRVCQVCRRKTNLRGAIVASHYEGYIKQLVRDLKYANRVAAAEALAQVLSATIDSAQFDLVVATPSSTRRFRQRGYNHAGLIATALAAQLKLLSADVLRRHGHSRQVGTSRQQRLQQMNQQMYTVRPHIIKDSRVLVVDDVITTGATITEAGRALKAAGARYIWAAAVAKH